jgi:hypothetical protein
MVLPKSLDQNQFLYTDHTDNTELSVKNGKKSVCSVNSVYLRA